MALLLTFSGLLALLAGYLIGSIPFGLVLTKAAGLGDVRQIGSGNIGATNVLRTGNKGLAAATLLLDVLKGTIAVLIVYDIALRLGAPVQSANAYSHVAGLGALVGHTFPVWLGFKGGKGVATFIGVLIGMYWPAAVWFGVVWLAVAVVVSRIVARDGSGWQKVWRGETAFAWNALLIALGWWLRRRLA